MSQIPPAPPPRISEQPAPDFDEALTTPISRPSKTNRMIFVLAAVLFCIAAGLGYYAYSLWTQQRQTAVKLDSAKTEVVKLTKEKKETTAKVSQMEQEQAHIENELKEGKKRIEELEMKLAATESVLGELREKSVEVKKAMKEFQGLLSQFKRMIDSGRLQIRFRRGRMIVELPEKVLFPTGSADLTDEGRQAIRDVAKVLRKYRYKRFIVAGHTDSVPISNEQYRSNWDLSAMRAVNVTQALIRSGIKPTQLIAAGLAQFDPVASNASQAGRQKNRRIEIVLEPQLRDLEERIEKQIVKAKKNR